MLVLRLDQLRLHGAPRSGVRCPLRQDMKRRTDGNCTPELLDLLVREGDAAFRPVEIAMCRAYPRLSRRENVAHDVATGRHAQLASTRAMGRIRVGDAECAVILALRVPCF